MLENSFNTKCCQITADVIVISLDDDLVPVNFGFGFGIYNKRLLGVRVLVFFCFFPKCISNPAYLSSSSFYLD